MPKPRKHYWKVWVNRPEPEPGYRWPRKSFIFVWADTAEELVERVPTLYEGFTVKRYELADDVHEAHTYASTRPSGNRDKLSPPVAVTGRPSGRFVVLGT